MRRPDLGRLARTIGWLVLTAALAFGGAGLVGQLSHPAGDARREELTYTADLALKGQLDGIASQLSSISSLVDGLSNDAKEALVAVSAGDGDALKTALDRGSNRAALAQSTVETLRSSLAGLPGEGPEAAAEYSNATLVRRASLLAALGSIDGLSPLWNDVTAKASSAATLMLAIRNHDTTVAAAAQLGVQAKYAAAVDQLGQAATILDQVVQLRTDIVSGSDSTVLDDWIGRHQRYDAALLGLYKALAASGGKRNPVVDAAYRAENIARADLPPDNRAIVIILAEVGQAGLNQAVIAIETARGHIDEALAAISPA